VRLSHVSLLERFSFHDHLVFLNLSDKELIMTSSDEVFSSVARLLRQAKHVAFLTGAGISAESGIPTFRDSLTGLWQHYNAEDLATPQAFSRNEALVWGWYEWRRMKVMQAQPNAGHLALAELSRRVPHSTLITQNVDDLHERAGSLNVLHLHGSLFAPRCFTCDRPGDFPSERPDEPESGRSLTPPVCLHCGGSLRPGVVWFGETLLQKVWQQAEIAVRTCDVLLVIGTSGLVYPAAGLPALARHHGKSVLVINPLSTEIDEFATHLLHGSAGTVLPRLITRLSE
jgi:NAD-dependent deacetylase